MQAKAGQTVLITGASSGIGAALAREFATQGAALVLLARRVELLNELAQSLRSGGTQVETHYCDVTREHELQALMERLTQRGIELDVVVANAGFGVVGQFVELSPGDFQRQFATNVFGVIHTAYATLATLRRRRGRLVIMGSVTGYVAQPGAAAYAMSKFAVRALAESLRAELAADGISVTLLSPGVIESNLRRVDNQGVFHAQAVDPLPAWLRMPTAQAARLMVRAIQARKPEQIITWHARLAIWLSRCAPWLLRYLFKFGLRARTQPGK